MYAHRLSHQFIVVMLVLVILATACAPQVDLTTTPTSLPATSAPQVELAATATSLPASATTTSVSSPGSVTLHLAVADAGGRPSEAYVLEFVEQVKALSKGDLTIEPVWEAAGSTDAGPAGFEAGVIQLVQGGQADLGLAGSRAFDIDGTTSFQALQAPFLITDDALSTAVATSDIGTRMLDSLSSAGMVGLTLWPEDLRHPFSLIPEKPLLSPEDFAGLNIRTIPSDISYLLIETLGGSPVWRNTEIEGAESGLLQGASLSGNPTATGNVIFFPKFQVLFANSAAFDKLSEIQRTILREAAAATQKKAIAEHPSEVDAATIWCNHKGTVVMASEEQVAAFEAAAQPVFDKIEQDPINAELITAIRELKAQTPPSPGADSCAPTSQMSETLDPSTYANGILNGTWDYVMSEEDRAFFEADLEAESGYEADELRIRMGFDNHEWWQGFVFDGELWLHNGVPEGDGGTFRIEDDLLIQTGAQGQIQVTYTWVLNGDQLTLTVVEECDVIPTGLNCRDDRSQIDPIMIMVTEHTYIKSGDDGSY